jgi:hypothetical protein
MVCPGTSPSRMRKAAAAREAMPPPTRYVAHYYQVESQGSLHTFSLPSSTCRARDRAFYMKRYRRTQSLSFRSAEVTVSN